MHLCLARAREQQFALSLYMNGSPHLQAVLTLGLGVPARSAKCPLALDLPRKLLLNRVCSQHGPVYVKRTLFQREQGQSGNMLVIVVSCHRASMNPLYFC